MRLQALFVLMFLLSQLVAAGSRWLDDDDEAAHSEDVTSKSHASRPPSEYDEDSSGASSHRRSPSDVANLNKNDQIAIFESDLDDLRHGRLAKAIDALHKAGAARNTIKSGAGWFPDANTKARIAQLDKEVERRMNELAVVQQEEKALVSRLKPLYGIVSTHFVQEQKQSMANSLKTVQELSYNQAWYSSLFNAHRAESLSDIILGFFIEWLVGYIIMYPFAVLYYGLWTLPWSIFEFSSGSGDLVPAVVAYVLALSVMLVPLVCIVGGIIFFVSKNKHVLERMAQEQEQRRQERQQQQARYRQGLYGR
jgi:hypothetical protein